MRCSTSAPQSTLISQNLPLLSCTFYYFYVLYTDQYTDLILNGQLLVPGKGQGSDYGDCCMKYFMPRQHSITVTNNFKFREHTSCGHIYQVTWCIIQSIPPRASPFYASHLKAAVLTCPQVLSFSSHGSDLHMGMT